MSHDKEIEKDLTLICNDISSYLVQTKSNFSRFYFKQASDQFSQSILPIIKKSQDPEQTLYNSVRKLLNTLAEKCSFLSVRGPEDTPTLKVDYIGVLARRLVEDLTENSLLSITNVKDCITSAIFDHEHPNGIDITENKDLLHYNMHEKLVLMCQQGDLENLKLLLRNDLDLNYRNSLPIVKAAELGRTEIVKLLVEHQADITYNNYEPLRISIDNRQMETVEYLISLKPQRSLRILKTLTHTPDKMIDDLMKYSEQFIDKKDSNIKFTR